MDLIEAIKKRRSIRSFNDKPVPIKLVKQMIETACWAPSACNRQLWRFVIITDSDIKQKLVGEGAINLIAKAPVTVAVFYHKTINRENYSNIQSASAAIQNLLLIAQSKGIGSLWSVGSCDNEKINPLLKVGKEFKLIAFVLLGYTEAIPHSPKRKPLSEIVGVNTFPAGKAPSTIYPDEWDLESIKEFQRRSCRASEMGTAYQHFPKIVEETIVNEVIPRIKGKHLDLFSYDGSLLRLLARDKKIFAFEMTQETQAFVEKRMEKEKREKNAKFVKETGLERIERGSFDSASLLFRLEMLNEADQKKTINHISKLLKKQGLLFLFYRNQLSPGWMKALYRLKIKGQTIVHRHYMGLYNFGPYYAQSNKKIERLLSEKFTIKNQKGFGFLPNKQGMLDQLRPFCEYQFIIAENKVEC